MLERLFTSAARVKILTEILLNPGKEYHIRQLARTIDRSPILVQKELKNLEGLGLLQRRKQGNLVLYSVEKSSVIVEDLKRIFLKTEGLGNELLKNLKTEQIRYAFIFGSFAKGVETTRSDIDLLVIGTVEEKSLLRSISAAESRVGREISVIHWTFEEFMQKVKERIPLLLEILKTNVIMIIGDETEFKRLVKEGSSKTVHI